MPFFRPDVAPPLAPVAPSFGTEFAAVTFLSFKVIDFEGVI